MPLQTKIVDAIIGGAFFGLLAGVAAPALADHTKGHIKGYNTMDAMGCMLLKECTDGVDQIHSIDDLRAEYPDADWDIVADEFNKIMLAFARIGVDVHLADSKYFPIGHRGVYHTVSNHFYLNRAYMHRPHVLMSVTRHEGWHAAQDCMAGSIKNNICLLYTSDAADE